MKPFRLISAVLLPILVLAGCSEADSAYILVSLKQSSVPAAKGQVFVSVSSNSSWTLALDGDVDWARLKTTSGEGDRNSIILDYDENMANTGRSLTLSATSCGKTASASFTQLAATAEQDGGQEGDSGSVIEDAKGGKSAAAPYHWLELPETDSRDGLDFIWHNFGSDPSRRNYSLYWDYDHLVAHWVAYPLNSSLIGSGSRTDNWGLDPYLSSDEQPVLYKAYQDGNNGWYARGHQLPSADRLDREANVQTFYGTNMTPQLNDKFNGTVWAKVEDAVRKWSQKSSSVSDTLYVVTGCVLDGHQYYVYDNNGKKVTVPTGYFKAVLRYSQGSTVGYSGFMGLAIFMEHKNYTGTISVKDYSMSIDDLEKKIGMDLFVNLPSVVGDDTAAKVEAEDPTRNSWWW